jgi:hypothetical protein
VLSFTEKELKDIRYVVVTVSLKSDKENETKGLFLGYRPLTKVHTQLVSNDEEFIWLQRGENVYILNTAHYNVGNIDIQLEDLEATHRTSTQEVGLDRLRVLQEALVEDKRTSPNGLIEVDTYTLPLSLQKEMNKDEARFPIVRPDHNRSGAASYSPPRSNYQTYKKKEPSTSVIKRTTKYPTSTAILKMRAKIKEIRDGKYKPPELPAIPADKDKSEKKAAV